RLGDLAKKADAMIDAEKQQADQLKKIKGMPPGPDAFRAVDQLADDRQQLADDLSNLEREIRAIARQLDANQHATAEKLRSALQNIDDADLESRLQRTADWLRTMVDPASNGTEGQIVNGLKKL